jgi:hypothetical protein
VKAKTRSILFDAKNEEKTGRETPRRLAELQPETKIDKKNRQKKEEDSRGRERHPERRRRHMEKQVRGNREGVSARKRGRKRERYIYGNIALRVLGLEKQEEDKSLKGKDGGAAEEGCVGRGGNYRGFDWGAICVCRKLCFA